MHVANAEPLRAGGAGLDQPRPASQVPPPARRAAVLVEHAVAAPDQEQPSLASPVDELSVPAGHGGCLMAAPALNSAPEAQAPGWNRNAPAPSPPGTHRTPAVIDRETPPRVSRSVSALPEPDPLILTLQMEAAAFAAFDGLRRRHFPETLNHIPATRRCSTTCRATIPTP